MANYTPEDTRRADFILRSMLNYELSKDVMASAGSGDFGRGERRQVEHIPDDLVLVDLQADVKEFSKDIKLSRYLRVPMPAFEINGEKVPVSFAYALSYHAGPFDRTVRTDHWEAPYTREYLSDAFRMLYNENAFGFIWIEQFEAENAFRKPATDFIATRLAGLRTLKNEDHVLLRFPQLLGKNAAPTPGCNFKVTSNSQGLRVFWSGAYYVSPSYFSHPTSPASSVLQSGTYIFGVDGGAYGNNIQWDKNAVVSLPGNITQLHLNY
jgi:hypothetical protein